MKYQQHLFILISIFQMLNNGLMKTSLNEKKYEILHEVSDPFFFI